MVVVLGVQVAQIVQVLKVVVVVVPGASWCFITPANTSVLANGIESEKAMVSSCSSKVYSKMLR